MSNESLLDLRSVFSLFKFQVTKYSSHSKNVEIVLIVTATDVILDAKFENQHDILISHFFQVCH